MGKSLGGVLAAALVIAVFKLGPYFLTRAVIREATSSSPAIPQTTIPTFDVQKLGLAPVQTPIRKDKEVRPAISTGRVQKSALLRQWTAPSEAKYKPDALLNPARITGLAFDLRGDCLISISKGGVHVWNAATGKRERTFEAAERFPAVVSRDGRFAAIPTTTDVTIYDVETGRSLSHYELEKDRILTSRWVHGGGAFSPSGEYLLIGCSKVGKTDLLAIESRTGRAERVQLPADDFGSRIEYEQLEPVPGSARLLLNGSVGKINFKKKHAPVVTFDPATQKATELTALRLRPWTLNHNRGMRVSNDGIRVIAYDDKVVAIVNRVTDKEIATVHEDDVSYSDPSFTPDGKRCVFLRHTHFYVINLAVKDATTYPPDTVELYDAKTGNRITAFAPEDHGFAKRLTSVEVSPDGKKVAVAAGTRLAVFDFESAFFGTKPLPPLPLPTEAESYAFVK